MEPKPTEQLTPETQAGANTRAAEWESAMNGADVEPATTPDNIINLPTGASANPAEATNLDNEWSFTPLPLENNAPNPNESKFGQSVVDGAEKATGVVDKFADKVNGSIMRQAERVNRISESVVGARISAKESLDNKVEAGKEKKNALLRGIGGIGRRIANRIASTREAIGNKVESARNNILEARNDALAAHDDAIKSIEARAEARRNKAQLKENSKEARQIEQQKAKDQLELDTAAANVKRLEEELALARQEMANKEQKLEQTQNRATDVQNRYDQISSNRDEQLRTVEDLRNKQRSRIGRAVFGLVDPS